MAILSYHSVNFVPLSPYRRFSAFKDVSSGEIIAERFRDLGEKSVDRTRLYIAREMANWYCLTEMRGVNPLFDLKFNGWHEWYVIGLASPANHPDINIGKNITQGQQRTAAYLEKQVHEHFQNVPIPHIRQVIPFRR